VSDGTPAGTRRIADVNPGPASSAPQFFRAVGPAIVFSARGEDAGFAVWGTDGGAVEVIFAPGGPGTPGPVSIFGQSLVCSADDGVSGTEPWRLTVDGGPERLADLRPGAMGSGPSGYVVLGGALYFQANDGTSGVELWTTDGTPAGTRLFADLNPTGGSFPQNGLLHRGALYFAANDGAAGNELWRLDADAGAPQLVIDLNPAPNVGSAPQQLVSF
jgi:ELWxxDGT repeat protein